MIITVDLETFYDRDYSLTQITTEEYIRDSRFQVIGMAVKIDDGETKWYPKPEVKRIVSVLPWDRAFVVCQQTAFDGAILGWKYGVRPKAWVDIMGMSRALYPHEKSHSLKSQAQRMGVGVKGDEVINALGKRFVDFDAEALARYGEYCKNDVELTKALFDVYMMRGFPVRELKLIDLTLRMFIEPKLVLDATALQDHLDEVRDTKRKLLNTIVAQHGSTADAKEVLMSNPKFAEALRSLGVEPPMKVSPTTGKETYAFAKTDEKFKELLEHDDPRVQALVAARLGVKTTIEETRTERFIGMAGRGAFPVPLRYYGAHSGRWSGQDSINLQNLPSRGANAGKIKKAIRPPHGHVFIDCDSAQIEARTLAWLAGQTDLIDAFENKQDVYRIMAGRIYSKAPEDVTSQERFIGKSSVLGCFGADTKVLTNSGWKRIVDVSGMDMLWDGEEWVTHQGVVPQGEKEVLTSYGVSATSDHEILTEHGWVEWSEVLKSPSLFQSAINRGSLKSFAGNLTGLASVEVPAGIQSCVAHVGGKAVLIGTTLSVSEPLGAIPALKERLRLLAKNTGGTSLSCRIWSTVKGYLIELPVALGGVITRVASNTLATVAGVYTYTSLGARIGVSSCDTFYRCPVGINLTANSTGWTTTKDTSPRTYDSLAEKKMSEIDGPSSVCKQRLMTYDIAYAGPRNRYTIATSAGPLIVHNCGYGVGASKLRLFLKTGGGVDVGEVEAKRIVDAYRSASDKIVDLWKRGESALMALVNGQTYDFDPGGVVKVVPDKGLLMPSGLYIQYPELRRVSEGGKAQWVYTSKSLPVKIYGGKVVENVCQSIARCIIGEQMLRISKRYQPVLTVHDAIAIVAPQDEADAARAYVEECMSWRPAWAQTLPLACESGMGATYGDC